MGDVLFEAVTTFSALPVVANLVPTIRRQCLTSLKALCGAAFLWDIP
jgi:hypothetical protein